ncbi:MAG TPA: hypothetical protein VF208_09070 [Candidatus Binatia bacterium]
MSKLSLVLLLVASGLLGCSTPNVSRSGTLLSGMTQYQGDMQTINASSRWPDRQRAAGTLKTVILGTVGASPEFYRLVDLDLRKREFIATMRDTNVRPDRLREMQDELVFMEDEIAALKPVVKTQLMTVASHEHGDPIENAATLGLLGMAIDNFSTTGRPSRPDAPSTRVGQFLVTDLGTFSTVRTPEGKSYRCNVFNVPEEGGGIRCESVR